METAIICAIPIAYTAVVAGAAYWIGRYGLPVKWTGWRDRRGEEDY